MPAFVPQRISPPYHFDIKRNRQGYWIAEYQQLSPSATGNKLAVSGEVNRMIAAAITWASENTAFVGKMAERLNSSGAVVGPRLELASPARCRHCLEPALCDDVRTVSGRAPAGSSLRRSRGARGCTL